MILHLIQMREQLINVGKVLLSLAFFTVFSEPSEITPESLHALSCKFDKPGVNLVTR